MDRTGGEIDGMGPVRHPQPYWPGLDGVRGLAVIAVLLFHAGISWAQGGFLGVSLFFTLSGFLITSLLVAEQADTATIGLRSFWARRFRRLLPASILALGLAAITARIVLPLSQRVESLVDIQAAAVNLANWRFIWRGAVYVDASRLPSPVQHYWSLAIEEQFYLVFPLVALVALRRSRGALAWALAGFVALSVVQQLRIDDATRVYFGTDTRAAELAIGGLLALGRTRIADLADRTSPRLPDLGGAIGLVAAMLLWWRVPYASGALHSGGLAAVGVVWALVIFAAVEGRLVPAILSFRPLVALGLISYGVYLYHFPIYMLLDDPFVELEGPALLGLRLGVTLVISIASFTLVERPIRRGTRLRGYRSALAIGTGIALLLAGTFVLAERLRALGPLGDDLTVVVGPVVTSPEGDATRPPHVVVVGDSTAAGMERGLRAWGQASGRLRVSGVTSPGCATYAGSRLKVREGYEFAPDGCGDLFQRASELVTAESADAIVVFIGSSQLADWTYDEGSGWQDVTDPAVAAGYRSALRGALDQLALSGVPILWADVPEPAWDLTVFAGIIGAPLPGSGPVLLNDPRRAPIVQAIDAEVIPTHPLAVLLPWRAHLTGDDGTISAEVRPDGLHVDEARIAEFAEAWLLDLLDASYDEVVSRRPPGLVAPAAHGWSAAPAPG